MKPIKILLFIFLLSLGISETPETLLSSGQVKLQEGDLQGALTDFQLALEQDDQFAPAMVELAKLQLRFGDMDSAKELMYKAVTINEEYREEFERISNINMIMNDGQRAIKNRKYEEAYDIFKKVADDFPYFSSAFYNMGSAKKNQNQYDLAVPLFKNALYLNPNYESARKAINNISKATLIEGTDTYKRGNFEGAIKIYSKILTYDSTFSKAHFQLGVLQAKMGNYNDAIDFYLDAVKYDSSYYQAWFAMGISQKNMSDESAALESYQNAININPKYAKAYNSMADIYRNKKDYSIALTMLDSALSMDEDYGLALNNMGNIYMLLDSVDLAIKNFEKCTLLDSKNVRAWTNLATLYNKLGDCGSAIKAAREATDRKKRFGAAWFELGIAEWCNGKGNKTAALNAFEKARDDRSWRQLAEHEIDRIKNPE